MPFKLDSDFFKFLGNLTNLIVLNLICLICCIPIITIGPAICALYFCIMKLVRKEHIHIMQGFIKSFKDNLKQGIILQLIIFFSSGLLYFNLQLTSAHFNSSNIFKILTSAIVILIFLFLLLLTFLYPVQALFSNQLKSTFYNAFILSICNLPRTLIMLLLNLLPVILFFLWPNVFLGMFPFYIFIGFSVTVYINCIFLKDILKPYLPDEELE